MIMIVIINKLCKKKQFSSYYLIFKSISSQIILNNLIQSFILIIHLKMISDREMLFNHLNLADFLLKIWHNVRIFIHHNAFQEVKMTFNMLKKEFHEVCNCSVISDEYKQCILCNMINYSQNAVIFLIIFHLHQQKQSCDSI